MKFKEKFKYWKSTWREGIRDLFGFELYCVYFIATFEGVIKEYWGGQAIVHKPWWRSWWKVEALIGVHLQKRWCPVTVMCVNIEIHPAQTVRVGPFAYFLPRTPVKRNEDILAYLGTEEK